MHRRTEVSPFKMGLALSAPLRPVIDTAARLSIRPPASCRDARGWLRANAFAFRSFRMIVIGVDAENRSTRAITYSRQTPVRSNHRCWTARQIKAFSRGVVLACCLGFPTMGLAQIARDFPPDANEEPLGERAYSDLIGDELLLFEDMPVVISATRQLDPIDMSPVPVTVVTADDIHYSGLTTIPDVLAFALGIDVLEVDRNRFAVGVRGMHHSLGQRTLFLLDGRDAGSPAVGGVDFLRLPVLLDDIEQIEIVRGPGGAAWGANAFNGFVNIITKKPEGILGVLASSTISEFRDANSQLRWATRTQDWRSRVSLGYDDGASSEDALGSSQVTSSDFSRNMRLDGEVIRRLSDDTDLSLGVGYVRLERGPFDFVGQLPTEDERLKTLRTYARIDRQTGGEGAGYLQWFVNYEDIARPSLRDFRSTQHDIETQWSVGQSQSHELLVGGNVRWLHFDADDPGPLQSSFPREPFDQQWLGAFLLDRWQATHRLVVEGQIRGDWYSESGSDWSSRLTGLYGLDSRRRHTLRVSTAKAFRTPLLGVAESRGEMELLPSPPFPPDSYAFSLLRAGNLENEGTWSAEAGYHTILSEELTFRTDLYYQHYTNLIYTRQVSPPPMTSIMFENGKNADATGVEIETRLSRQRWQASAWYAYQKFDADETVSMRGFYPATNKAGVTGRLFLDHGLVLSTSYRYADVTRATPVTAPGVPPSHRWDLTATKDFAGGRGELLAGVRDVLDDTGVVIIEGGSFNGHETPGRRSSCADSSGSDRSSCLAKACRLFAS